MRAPAFCLAILCAAAPLSWAQSPPAGDSLRPNAQNAASLPSGGWMVLPIALCLCGTLALIVTGAARTSPERIGPRGDEETVRALFRQKDFAGADAFCRQHPSSLTKILRAGIGLISSGQSAVKDGLEAALATERLRLHTHFSYLHALALCTPLLGVLETLVGISRALLAHTPGAPDLAPAVGAALVPSVLGLLAGIVASAAFYILRERAAAAMLRLQDAVTGIFRQVPYDSLAGLNLGAHE